MKSKLNRQISSLLSEYGPVRVLRAIKEETADSPDKSIPLDMDYAIDNIAQLRQIVAEKRKLEAKYGRRVGGL